MRPNLRSTQSAPTTPEARCRSRSRPLSLLDRISPRTIPSRRTLRCMKCGRPRAGHPRAGCPYSSIVTDDPDLMDTFASGEIFPEDVDMPVDDKSSLRRRLARHSSPPPTINAVFNDSQVEGTENRASRNTIQVVEWRNALDLTSDAPSPPGITETTRPSTPIQRPSFQRPRSLMPGTLQTPTPSFFDILSQSSPPISPVTPPPPPPLMDIDPIEEEMSEEQDDPREPTPYSVRNNIRGITPWQERSGSSRPIERTSSIDQRDQFLSGLVSSAHLPPASVFSLPVDDIWEIQHAAAKVGFYARVIIPSAHASQSTSFNDEDDRMGWLILGNDNKAVQSLFDGVNRQSHPRGTNHHRRQPSSNGGGGTFGAVAGGAVVGAVATITGLAFS